MKNVVITGASSGIGFETAKIFLDEGNKVYCLSRRPCELENAINIKCDITDEQQVIDAFKQIPKIDVLINNAGYGISGATEFTELKEMREQFELNLFAHITVTKAALPKLKESKGKIIFISSAAAPFPIPFQSFYSASKAAVETVSSALKNELKMFGVDVSCVRLGDTKTAFTAEREKSFKGDDVYEGLIGRSVAVMERDEQNGMPPSAIAKAIVKLSKKRKMPPIITVGLQYQFLCILKNIVPYSIVNEIIGMMYMPKK
ncbi:MAG: SDR family NAD(P)-dependent oxidoreductase [Ruminococcaceae bacterium]|nr:SDR family NAD(P)-dependent oxidoreductase [Oscillospiraceae bacterium]